MSLEFFFRHSTQSWQLVHHLRWPVKYCTRFIFLSDLQKPAIPFKLVWEIASSMKSITRVLTGYHSWLQGLLMLRTSLPAFRTRTEHVPYVPYNECYYWCWLLLVIFNATDVDSRQELRCTHWFKVNSSSDTFWSSDSGHFHSGPSCPGQVQQHSENRTGSNLHTCTSMSRILISLPYRIIQVGGKVKIYALSRANARRNTFEIMFKGRCQSGISHY